MLAMNTFTYMTPGACTAKQVAQSQNTFFSSGSSYSKISNQVKCSHEGGYQLDKSTQGFPL